MIHMEGDPYYDLEKSFRDDEGNEIPVDFQHCGTEIPPGKTVNLSTRQWSVGDFREWSADDPRRHSRPRLSIGELK
jgi:hypothetical protein